MADVTDISGQGGTLLPAMLANAVPGMMAPQAPQAPGGIGNLLGALLGGGGGMQPQQPGMGMGAVDPRAIQMMLYQRLNQPSQNKFANVINPIVALLTARQMTPSVVQQQQQQLQNEHIKQVLEALKAGSLINQQGTQAGLNTARTTAIAEESANLTPEEKQQRARIKGGLTMSAAETSTAANQALQTAISEGRLSVEQARVIQEGLIAKANLGERQAGRQQEGEQFRQTQDLRERQYGTDVQYKQGLLEQAGERLNVSREQIKAMRERTNAMGGSPELKDIRLKTAQANLSRIQALTAKAESENKPLYNKFKALMEAGKMMPEDTKAEFAEKNIMPLLTELTGESLTIPYDSWDPIFWGWKTIEPKTTSTAKTPPMTEQNLMTPPPGQVPVTPQTAVPSVQTPTGTTPPMTDAQRALQNYKLKKYGTAGQ